MLKGINASEGIEIKPVFKLEEVEITIVETKAKDVAKEKDLLDQAVAQSVADLSKIKDKIAKEIDEEHAMIFEAHKQIASDIELLNQSKNLIENEGYSAAHAYDTITNNFIAIFDSMDDEYMKERAADIKDVKQRVLSYVLGHKPVDVSLIDEEVIVVSHDLTPSVTAQLDRRFVKGFATNIGGRTSHSAIMSRSLEIPAVVGMKDITSQVENGDVIILNGIDGYVIVNPSQEEINQHMRLRETFLKEKELLEEYVDKASVTKDNVEVELAANIGSVADLDLALKYGADGIGLFRTEFLYMDNDHLPTEEEQYKVYKEVLEKMGSKKVVIRTLDIGGDKHLDYYPMDHELNPFLGHRAVRLCLSDTDLFKTQLKALLRASVYGNLHIMFPMIATINELLQVKEILQVCEKELQESNLDFGDYKVGIMVEIPAVAVLADQFAKHVDFLSIGTNDLIQYTFAADRMNEKVSYLYQPFNPSLIRLIEMAIKGGHKEGIWVGMCGEMAGDTKAIPLLLGLGLDEFSMSATSVLKARHLVSTLSKEDLGKKMASLESCSTESDVEKLFS
jgi:phosphotransferase system enzyme I (PtsI)